MLNLRFINFEAFVRIALSQTLATYCALASRERIPWRVLLDLSLFERLHKIDSFLTSHTISSQNILGASLVNRYANELLFLASTPSLAYDRREIVSHRAYLFINRPKMFDLRLENGPADGLFCVFPTVDCVAVGILVVCVPLPLSHHVFWCKYVLYTSFSLPQPARMSAMSPE